MTLPAYVGRYEVRREIARGGFAVVVQAWDEQLQSLVALKILHRELALDDEIKERFLKEARLLRRIRSPNVVSVHDIGRLNDGCPYFVMDYADRGTLAHRLDPAHGYRGADPKSVATLVDALADGLAAIHEAGVVHRDIKPANVLFQAARRAPAEPDTPVGGRAGEARALVADDERILVGDLGIAKDLARHGAMATVMAGTPFFRAPEQGRDAAEITPAADVFAATVLLWQVLTGRQPPEAGNLKERMHVVPPAWRDLIQRGMAADAWARFQSMEDWRSAVHGVLAQEAAEPAGAASTAYLGPVEAVCPYKGLAAYQSEDARRFFGREALIDELVRRIQRQRVLVVGGPSGGGKSSLLRAGLIPALAAGALSGSDRWRVALFTPGRDPLSELHFKVSKTLAAGPAVPLADLLERPTMARHLGGADGRERPLLLCIDQFEELFTLAPPTQRAGFIAALSAMTDPADSQVRLVIAVRADFYAACAQIPWMAERITENQVLVGPMTRSELRRAITEPARRAGLHLERGLVDAIIDEAGSDAGSLPLVAHALVETWERRQGNTLTLDGFRAAGGVAGAISQTADATFERRFTSAEQEATRRLFLLLVTPGEGTPDTRRILARSEIEVGAPGVMHRIVECLTEVRLLTVDDASVQIAHEALLHTWPRLVSWIEECRDDLRTRQRISHAAAEWDEAGREPDLLYRGAPLLSALEWDGANPGQLGALDRVFLDASVEAGARAEAAEEEKRRKGRRVRRIAIAALAFFALGATLASVAASIAFRQAILDRERAEEAGAVARERFAGALGAVARGLAESDPLLALALAAEAVARAPADAPGFDARAAMIAARQVLARGAPVLDGGPIDAGDALAVAISPDGRLIADARRDGTIDLISTATRQRVGAGIRAHEGGIEDVEFAPEGGALASAGDDGLLKLWTLGEVPAARTIHEFGDIVWGLGFSPDGLDLASAGEDGTVQVWEVASGAAAGDPLLRRTGDVLRVAFSPDGSGVVAGNGEGEIYGWAVPSGEPLFEPVRAHTSDVWGLIFNRAGDRFATASSDGTSVVLGFPSGRIVGRAFAGEGPTMAVAFTADDQALIGGGFDGTLRVWDIGRGAVVATAPSGHSQAIIDGAASRDGSVLATLGADQLIRLWRMGTAYPMSEARRVEGEAAKGLALGADGALMAAGDEAGVISVWDVGAGRPALVLPGHAGQVWALAFSPDGRTLASADRDGEVRLWSPQTGASALTIASEVGPVWSLAFTPDGARLVAAGDAGAQVSEVATGALVAILRPREGTLTRAALSGDGSMLAASSSDGRVVVWDLADSSVIREIAADVDVVWSVAFSPDGRGLATASSDEVVALWDLESGQRRGAFTGHVGGATDVAFLGDGVTLVAVDRSGRVHVWDTVTGRQLAEAWPAHAAAAWRIAVAADGERFATSGDDGTVRLWDVLSLAGACAIVGSSFDETRRTQYLGPGEPAVACPADGGPPGALRSGPQLQPR